MKDLALKEAFRSIIDFPESDWELIKPNIKSQSFKKGELFLDVGQTSTTLGFVLTGMFRKYYIKDGDEINLWFFKENEFLVSYVSFLQQIPSHLYIEALEDAEIIYLNYQNLQDMYAISGDWERMGRLICESLYVELHNRIESLLFDNATTRYEKFLRNRPELVQRVHQYHLASYLGIKPQSLSRIRKEALISQ